MTTTTQHAAAPEQSWRLTEWYTLGYYLHAHRTQAGLSQYEVALRAGIQPSYLARLENGEATHPCEHVVHGLARALGVRPTDLYRLIAEHQPAELLPPFAAYLETKFHLHPADIIELTEHLQQLTTRY